MSFTTFGTIRYSPKLLGKRSEKWWVVVDGDEEIGRYYRHLYELSSFRVKKLQIPAWKAHITVVRNEEPPNKEAWEKHAGRQVLLECLQPVRTDGHYFWLDVICDQLLDLRMELGLPRLPEIPLHLSVAHLDEV